MTRTPVIIATTLAVGLLVGGATAYALPPYSEPMTLATPMRIAPVTTPPSQRTSPGPWVSTQRQTTLAPSVTTPAPGMSATASAPSRDGTTVCCSDASGLSVVVNS